MSNFARLNAHRVTSSAFVVGSITGTTAARPLTSAYISVIFAEIL